MELYGKFQKWIESIMSDDLENVARESKNLEDWDLDPKLNRMIFRALLCLSHSAERSKPSQTQTGKQIFDIADNLCYSLIEIPDLIKYFSSLYHIVRKLIAMQLYSEAMRITAWSFPSNLVSGLTSQHFDMYPKIANLWHEPAVDLIDALPKCISAKTEQKLLVQLLNNELKVLEVIAKERSAFILSRIIRYLIKLDAIPEHLKLEGNQNHRYIVKNFFTKIQVTLVTEEKYDVYHEALRFVNMATIAMVNSKSFENTPSVFTESCQILETIFARDTELSSCVLLYKHMGVFLLKPIHNSKEIPHWELEMINKETMNIIQNFKDGKGVSWNMRMVGYILQSLFNYWENCVSNGDKEFFHISVLRDILGSIKLMFFVLNSIPANNCEVCCDNSCRMKKNIHTVTVVSIKILVIVSKISARDLLKDVFPLVRELLEENVAAIFEMKVSGCAQWTALWNNCGINIYNLSVTCHKAFYEETAFLFSLLCSCIVRFEGINAVNSKINIKNPLSYMLHRLSSVHFNHGNYWEALTPCALNGLLSYQNSDSKAFRMWASIKHACAHSNSVLQLTMLSCLRKDMDIISEIGVNVKLRDYDLSELCLQELRGLHEARCDLSVAMQSVLDEMQILNSGSLEYAQGVNLLGYHMLHYQYDDNFPRYLNRAIRKLKEEKFSGDLHMLASANLDFYTFVSNLRKIVDHTKAEMETAKLALRPIKSTSHEGQPKNNDTIVPTYPKINVTEDSKLFSNLQQALNKWSLCIKNNIIGIIEEWQSVLVLRTIVIIGEYSRLHKFSTLETKAWELAYKIAFHQKDFRMCVYVVGRSTSLRNVKGEWIDTAKELTTELESSNESEADNAIAFFWVSLSNLYFEIGKNEEGAEILQRVLSLPNISPVQNAPGYLSNIDTVLKNYHFYANDQRNTKYMVYIVKCLYSMLSLMEYSPQTKVGVKAKQLYSSEILLTCTAHLSLRMNSLLSFKEISSHVINRLKLSQSSGVTLRVADCLKNLCFIDLSRMQLDDCVVKLQGLEYILQTEYIAESQNTKNPETSTNERDKPGSRDPRTNNASPVLRKTVFKIPDFISHHKCSCYKCSSVDYQYLVLSCTHIRAQLYFLQGHLRDAMEHFNGAFVLRRKMLQIESRQEIKWKENNEQNKGKQHLWKDYYHTVEYVLLLLDFSRFIRELEFGDGINVAIEAMEICENFRLHSHPIYVAAKELVLEYQFCEIFKDGDFHKFTVPDPSSIDVNKFIHTVTSLDSSSIATPASKPCVKKPRTIRRIKTPPLLKLTKVSMILSEDEDEEGSESPKSSWQRTKVSKNYRRPKTLTRKKLQAYLEAAPDPSSSENEEDEAAAGSSRSKIPALFIPRDTAEKQMHQETISEIMNKAISIFPNLSKQLTEVSDKKGVSEAEKIERVIMLVEEQGTNVETKNEPLDRGRRRCKSKNFSTAKSRLSNRDQNDIVDKLVTSFKEILISKKDAYTISLGDKRLSGNTDEASPMLPSISISNFTSNFGDNNRRGNLQFIFDEQDSDTLSIDKKSKKRLEFSESLESISSIKEPTEIPKPEHIQQSERLRTSDRIKRSRSQSSDIEQKKSDDLDVPNLERCQSVERKEKAKSSVRRGNKGLEDESDVSASGVTEIEKKTQDIKRRTRNSRRIQRSQSEISTTMSSSVDIIESSQLNNSDIVPTSDLEEKASIEKRRKGLLHKYKTRTSSRIVKSQSQVNGAISKLENVDNSDTISTSDPEDLTENKNTGQKNKSKALSRAKKSDKRLDPQLAATPDSPDKKEGYKKSEVMVLKEAEAPAKKQASKRPTSGRSKLKR